MTALLSLFIFAFLSPTAFAEDECTDYTIHAEKQTLGQVAREVYGNSREWKKITAWNKIAPPYRVKKGQVIKLCEAPKPKKASQLATSLPSDTKVSKGKKIVAAPPPKIAEPVELDGSYLMPVTQEVIEKDEETIYVVNERAPSLSMIALELYGDAKLGNEIAKWNHLRKPYKLALGQKLRLERKPTKDPKKADESLVNAWESLGNDWMAERIKKSASKVDAPPVPADLEPEALPVEKSAVVEIKNPRADAPLFEAPTAVVVEGEHETRWTTSGGPTFQFFRINGRDRATGADAVLLSKLSPGLEINVGALVHPSVRALFRISGYRSSLYPNTASTAVIENSRQTTLRFGLGAEKLFGAHTAVGALLNFSDELYVRGISGLSGVMMDSVKVFRTDLHAHYELFRYGGGLARAKAGVGLLFPTTTTFHQTRTGLAAGLGLGTITELGRDWKLASDIEYRAQSQSTSALTARRKDLIFGLQFEWKGDPL